MTIFANVKDITIPEGNVKKIQESISGRVLWEKKKKYDIDILESVAGFFKHNNSYIYHPYLYLEFEDNRYTQDYPEQYRKVQVGDKIIGYYVPYNYVITHRSHEEMLSDKILFPDATQWISYYMVVPYITKASSSEDQLFFTSSDIPHHLITLSNYVGNTVSVISLDYNNILADVERLEIIKDNYPKKDYMYFLIKENTYAYCNARNCLFADGTKRGMLVMYASRIIERN